MTLLAGQKTRKSGRSTMLSYHPGIGVLAQQARPISFFGQLGVPKITMLVFRVSLPMLKKHTKYILQWPRALEATFPTVALWLCGMAVWPFQASWCF
jgi:hypothetical protein